MCPFCVLMLIIGGSAFSSTTSTRMVTEQQCLAVRKELGNNIVHCYQYDGKEITK